MTKKYNGFEICKNVLNQLGGNHFLSMTGTKNITYSTNSNIIGMTLRTKLNLSKCNNLRITLNDNDLYTMQFIKHSNMRINNKTGKVTDSKTIVKFEYKDVFEKDLQRIFTEVTGFDTHL